MTMMHSRHARTVRALVGCVACAWLMSACAPVASYQRGALAHPTMSAEDLATGLESHVRAVSEGGSGGLGGGGGGWDDRRYRYCGACWADGVDGTSGCYWADRARWSGWVGGCAGVAWAGVSGSLLRSDELCAGGCGVVARD